MKGDRRMEFHVITQVSCFVGNRLIKEFHAVMFHGLAERDGEEYPHDPCVCASSESPSNLLISRPGHSIPPISQPSSHLVVSGTLADRLRPFPNIRLAPVVFKRLVDVDYEKGDMTWDERWGNVDPFELLRSLPDVPEFHRTVGSYYEVQCWRWRDIVEKYPDAVEVEIEEGMPYWKKRPVLRLSSRMFVDHPFIIHGDVLVSDTAFDILDAALDRDFFLVRDYAVP
jgi:hypothetical protein